MPRPPAPLRQLRDLELLINAHHPIIFLETIEEERAEVLLEHAAEHLGLLYLEWRPERGLEHPLIPEPLEGTSDPIGCLDHVARAETESLYHLKDFAPLLTNAPVRARLKEAHRALWRHRGAIVLTGPSAAELPEDVSRLVTSVALAPPSEAEYHRFLSDMLRDLRTRPARRAAARRAGLRQEPGAKAGGRRLACRCCASTSARCTTSTTARPSATCARRWPPPRRWRRCVLWIDEIEKGLRLGRHGATAACRSACFGTC
jgi:hypothetical protein